MSNTRYWTRKKDFFAAKCEEQEAGEDGRILREWTNPQSGEKGTTYEFHRKEFDGLVEYIDLKEGTFGGWEFKLGIQGSMRVNVLDFKLFQGNGKMVDHMIPMIRKIRGIDPNIPLHVSLFTPSGQDKYIKTYTVLRQGNKGLKEGFEKDPETKRFIGIPEPTIKEGIGGKKIYDFFERDKFLFDYLQEWVLKNEDIFAKNKEKRPPTIAEQANKTGYKSYDESMKAPEPTPESEAEAKTLNQQEEEDDDDDVKF
jgi:hypothetical protein